MKTDLTPDDKDQVFRITGRSWPYYAWDDGEWRAYPVDPRTGPLGLTHVVASGQREGRISSPEGFEEVVL